MSFVKLFAYYYYDAALIGTETGLCLCALR